MMKIKISWKYLLAFFALNGVVSELHEQAHINTGWLMNGCYGPRDFNAWQTCASQTDRFPFLPSLAGPLFSYAVMWIGVGLMLRAHAMPRRWLGFALIFAPLPFARIFTSLMGGGDEKQVFLAIAQWDVGTSKILGAAVAVAVCAVPIWLALRTLQNRSAWRYIAGFCVLPLLVVWAIKFKIFNQLLATGFLDDQLILGTPTLVLVYFLAMVALLAWQGKALLQAEGNERPAG